MSEQVSYTLSLKDLLTGKVKEADGAVNHFEGSLHKAQSAALSLGSAVGIAFGVAAVVGFGKRMVEAGSSVENALTGLTTLLRDKAEAQSVINKTMEDATRTPFAFEGLLAANKALISAGVNAKDARTDVLNLANAIAATGGGDDELQRMVVNLQQIKNTGEATALDIKQFAFAGVNIYKVLAEATGKPIEKVKEMKVSYEMLTMALQKAHDQGGLYAGGLEAMAGNTSVKISNLGDATFQLAVKMFNDLKPAIDIIINAIGGVVSGLSSGWNWMVRNKDIVQALAIGVGVGAAAWGVYTIYQNASSIATSIWAAEQWLLNAAMNANPIMLMVTAIGAVTAAIVYCYNHFQKFRAFLWGTWEIIKEVGSIIADFFIGLKDVLVGTFTLDTDQIARGFDRQASAVFDSGKRLAEAGKRGWEEGMKDFAKGNATVSSPATVGKKTAAVKTATLETKPQTKGAQGTKAITINVSIGNLVKEFKVQTTNLTEGAGKIKEMVVQALVEATNDSQIIAGS